MTLLENQQDYFGSKPVPIYRQDVETGKQENGLLIPLCFRDENGQYFTHYEVFVYRKGKMVRAAQETVRGVDLYQYISDNNKIATANRKGFTIGARTASPKFWVDAAAPLENWQKARDAQKPPTAK